MLVEVSGTENGKPIKYTYHVLDRYDKKRQVTAMARATAYTASTVAQLLAEKAVEEKGVVPPEKLGMNKELFEKFTGKMKKKRILIKCSKQ